ncbi:uncharacterized protein SETTUDRAFT_153918 [Exserohilum turcica Et28A]|uniref:Uncharacterized protein n=1 Tax=Exserohilum turcicum (strain 28A) TaxID=671987 RepID=R0IQM3_EXST2|nr:uncharacterized protein SETTUDRAFT_153918 [Exserohilum turcica Et28A]EOA87200.1 hypothetical protein SETTUDRAFT_153918 [Exserohilum turcica Et28A]
MSSYPTLSLLLHKPPVSVTIVGIRESSVLGFTRRVAAETLHSLDFMLSALPPQQIQPCCISAKPVSTLGTRVGGRGASGGDSF